MIVAIHQGNYLLWLGYYYKIAFCNTFVFGDNVQYTNGGYQNRCRIKTAKAVIWLTQPVCQKGRSRQLTNEVRFDEHGRWRHAHLRTIELAYKRASHFDDYFPMLRDLILRPDLDSLAEMNIALIETISAKLGFGPRFVRASGIDVPGKVSDRMIGVCKRLGATQYLSGTGAEAYQDEEAFRANGLDLRYSEFVHPEYPQLWGAFASGLSIVDLLFNQGPRAREVLLRATSTPEVVRCI